MFKHSEDKKGDKIIVLIIDNHGRYGINKGRVGVMISQFIF